MVCEFLHVGGDGVEWWRWGGVQICDTVTLADSITSGLLNQFNKVDQGVISFTDMSIAVCGFVSSTGKSNIQAEWNAGCRISY